jgi:hypothetical protein
MEFGQPGDTSRQFKYHSEAKEAVVGDSGRWMALPLLILCNRRPENVIFSDVRDGAQESGSEQSVKWPSKIDDGTKKTASWQCHGLRTIPVQRRDAVTSCPSDCGWLHCPATLLVHLQHVLINDNFNVGTLLLVVGH